MGRLEELAEEVRARGLVRTFAARGRELVCSPDGRELLAGENLRADPELRAYADAPPAPRPPALTRRALAGLAAAGALESSTAGVPGRRLR